jgi:hypothetical protein
MHEDTKRYVASCPECHRTGNISQRNSMPLKYNLQIDLFDVWGIGFMGPFKNSHGYEYILVMVDYVSKWVEAMPCHKASMEESITMIKNVIFPRFGTPRMLISVNTKNWYRKETDLPAEFGKETPFGRKFSSKHSVKMPAVGSTPSFDRRAVLHLEKEAFGDT